MGSSAPLPPGFRFHPTDEELVGYYLHRKVQGLQIELEVIPVVDLYKFDPWELPGKSFLPERDAEWFFFCPRDRKYPNGSRTNRATKAGYWKATGKDRKVVCQSSLIGYRKTLVFYRGRAPLGDRTYWVMHEYRLSDHTFEGSPNSQRVFALCRVVKKTGEGYKTNDIIRARKGTVIAGSSSNEHSISPTILDQQFCISSDVSSHGSYAHDERHQATPVTSPYQPTITFQSEPYQIESNNSRLWVSPDFILDSSKGYAQESQYFPHYEYLNSTRTLQSCENPKFLTSSLYSDTTGEIEPFNDQSQMSYVLQNSSENGDDMCLDESEVMPNGRFYQINSLRGPKHI